MNRNQDQNESNENCNDPINKTWYLVFLRTEKLEISFRVISTKRGRVPLVIL